MMKIITALKNGIFRSLKLWKGILILWFSSLVLVSLIAVPVKSAFNSVIGNSMITEKLFDRVNIEVFADMKVTFTSLLSGFSVGLIISFLAAFIINAFLTGGLFSCLKGSTGRFSAGEFFSASAKNFWSFLVVSLIISLIIIVVILLIIILPVLLAIQEDVSVEGAFFKTIMTVFPIFFFILALFLLVADYARAWLVSEKQNSGFRAISFGFSCAFRTFLSSYPLMIIILIVQLVYGWCVFKTISGINPVTGGEVFILFLSSQFLFLIKLMLKAWRYGAVTSLMEQNSLSQTV
jgi:hypothetical protein